MCVCCTLRLYLTSGQLIITSTTSSRFSLRATIRGVVPSAYIHIPHIEIEEYGLRNTASVMIHSSRDRSNGHLYDGHLCKCASEAGRCATHVVLVDLVWSVFG